MRLSPEYVAGFVDGEGCITVMRCRTPNKNGVSYVARIYIANTNIGILRRIQRDYGGRISSMGSRSNPNHKPGYGLTFNSLEAAEFARTILPYLVLKKRQAKLLIAFVNFQEKFRQKHHANRGFPSIYYTRAAKLHAQFPLLNAKGT